MRCLLPMMVLVAGCAVGPYAATPEYKLPETRTTAARQLNDALVTSGVGLSEVAADEVRLTWHERRQLTDKRWIILNREMDLTRVRGVARPVKVGELFELRVEAAGGQVTFEFSSGKASAAAEAAIWRLLQPLSQEEKRELGKKYFARMNDDVDREVIKEGRRRPNPDWTTRETAAGSLRTLTGKDYGNDLDAWLKFLMGEWYRLPAGE